MPTMSQPMRPYQRLSARVEKRGPCTTTTVPAGRKRSAWSPATRPASARSSGQAGAARRVAGAAAGERAQLRAVGIGGADVDDVRPAIVRVRAAGRPVDELVA